MRAGGLYGKMGSAPRFDCVPPYRERSGVAGICGPEPDEPVDKEAGSLTNRIGYVVGQVGKKARLLDQPVGMAGAQRHIGFARLETGGSARSWALTDLLKSTYSLLPEIKN